ncbi:hypothetical protein FF1_004444 [Malus domestica]
MSALDFPGCQPKCIYFVADDWEVLLMENLKGPFTGVSSTWKTEERKHTSTASIVQRRTFHHQSGFCPPL